MNHTYQPNLKKTLSTAAEADNPLSSNNIINALPHYVFWQDLEARYQGCNHNFAQLMGLSSPNELIGKTDGDLNWHPLIQLDTSDPLDAQNPTTQLLQPQEAQLTLPNGQSLPVMIGRHPIIDQDRIVGIASNITDISLLKEREQTQREAKELAELTYQSQNAFIVNMGHDLRNPVAGIIGLSNTLSNKLKGTEEHMLARTIASAGNSLMELLDNLIETAQIEANELPIRDKRFNLYQVIHNTLELIRPSAHEKDLELILEYDHQIPHTVISDEMRVHRILLNLITNAIKFTPSGSITVSTKLIKTCGRDLIIQLSIADTGIGIAADDLEIIFSRFRRLKTPKISTCRGLGLGLSIVKQFIADLDGEIHVNSTLNAGSQFTCTLPFKEALNNPIVSQAEPSQNPSTLKRSASSKNRSSQHAQVLLIEDSQISQLSAKYLLESHNFNVTLASTGEHAISLTQAHTFDLIILDIGLPGLSGWETAEIIQKNHQQTNKRCPPIVTLSAHIDHESHNKNTGANIALCLSKPLSEQNCQQHLRPLLDKVGPGKA